MELTKGQKFIAKKAKQLDANTRDLLAKGEMRYTDGDFYHRSKISASSNIENLIESTNEKIVGVSNIDKNRLPAGENLALQHLGVRYAEAATGTDIAAVTGWTTDKASVPAALLNAELTIVQDQKTLVRLPVARFFSEAKSEKLNGVEDVCELNSIQLIKADTPITAQIEYAEGQSVAAASGNDAFIEVRFLGDKTTTK